MNSWFLTIWKGFGTYISSYGYIFGYLQTAIFSMDYKSWDSSKVKRFMDLTCFYKAEMPNINNQTLDISGVYNLGRTNFDLGI